MYDIDLAAIYTAELNAFNSPEAHFRREYEDLVKVDRAKSKLAAARARLDRVATARFAN